MLRNVVQKCSGVVSALCWLPANLCMLALGAVHAGLSQPHLWGGALGWHAGVAYQAAVRLYAVLQGVCMLCCTGFACWAGLSGMLCTLGLHVKHNGVA